MGAWGTDNFANDDAMDWVAELESADDLSVVRAALEQVTGAEGYVEAPAGSVELAAAEVVAGLRGRPHSALPPEVAAWVERHVALDAASLVEEARRAVAVAGGSPERSELSELWGEADPEDRDAWRREVDDLRARLAGNR